MTAPLLIPGRMQRRGMMSGWDDQKCEMTLQGHKKSQLDRQGKRKGQIHLLKSVSNSQFPGSWGGGAGA